MNKKSWISIPLDNTIPDEEIIHYLTMSRDGIKDNKKKKQL
jgi:predicted DNA-binding protein (MmcQ/YjbR family)